MTNDETVIIDILKEYVTKKKSIQIEESHSIRNSYICANPNGPVDNSNCPEQDPLCNCPARHLIPKEIELIKIIDLYSDITDENQIEILNEKISEGFVYVVIKRNPVISFESFFADYEAAKQYYIDYEYEIPSDETLDKLLKESKECSLISEHLGDSYLGCLWESPNDPLSCTCPEIGENFYEYLKHSRTTATFWSTPAETPLIRNAQMNLINTQVISARIPFNLSVKPGQVIHLDLQSERILDSIDKEIFGPKRKQIFGTKTNSKFNGKWMVRDVIHKITGLRLGKTELILVRDSLNNTDGDI